MSQVTPKHLGDDEGDRRRTKVMDFKPEKFKKGDMVRFFRQSENTLGIVKGHDGGKVEVEWVLWPSQVKPQHGWYPMYKLQRVEKAG